MVNDDIVGTLACGGPPDFTTIQAAIDAADPGDDILVCDGTYNEDLSITKDGLTVRGFTGTRLVGMAVEAAASFPLAIPNIDIKANNVTIAGIKIVSPATDGSNYSSGIVLVGTNIKISDNDFVVSCGSPGSVAIQTYRAPTAGKRDIDGLIIADNTFTSLSCPTGGLGYEAVFINNQEGHAGTALPVKILSNTFSGALYRAVGVERRRTRVIGNDMQTDLTPTTTTDFGRVPWGVKVFNGFGGGQGNPDEVVVYGNEIGDGGAGNFSTGIVLQSMVTNSVVRDNEVEDAEWGIQVDGTGNTIDDNEAEDSVVLDCLDTSASPGNSWTDNEGETSSPAGICADD